MKKASNNILLFSIIIFVITASIHLYNKHVWATATGSGGGRISVVRPITAPDCAPCSCAHYHTIFSPSSGTVNQACFPMANVPITGKPVSPGSVGTQILGNWTTTIPTAASTNWGTSYQ